MIQKDLQGNLWKCEIGTMSSGKTFRAYQQEIERLNNELQDFKVQDISNQEQLYNLIEENERLNNIINELEEEISRHIALCTDVTLNDILDKLKELKEKE